MDRLTEIEIGGYSYSLNFSVLAASKIYERFGDIGGMQESMMDGFTEKSIADTLWVLDLLAEQGAAYQKIRNDKAIKPLDTENLPILLGMSEFNEVQAKMLEAVTKGIVSTVEVKPSKNAEATQGRIALRGFGFMADFLPFLRKS